MKRIVEANCPIMNNAKCYFNIEEAEWCGIFKCLSKNEVQCFVYLFIDERNFSSDEEDIGLPYRLKILQHQQRRVIIYLDISTYFQ